MPILGDSAKPNSGFIYSRSSSENQEAFEFTMPERGEVTHVGIWANADSGFSGDTNARMVVWAKGGSSSSGNDVLEQSDLFTLDAQPFDLANMVKHEHALLAPVELEAGVVFYAGFARNPSGSHQWCVQSTGSHIHRRRQPSWPGSMDGWDSHAGATRGIYVVYEPAAPGGRVRRAGVFGESEVYVKRGGVMGLAEVYVKRGGVWVPAE